ncbi:MAG: DUF4390 domain-containing protein [Nitrospirae bacterium]|uniref:DUF4390 domain-containing protein n=1 Tax=Candidatus Magnetobacterium casense TaxID=1455061 RepID=UPI000590D3DE|nr:DUF4390 domain-containing protein [Candidatus Magnetobacterium casensis]MBF0338174.1 DUF4390 domain-containing protein [Nitrospirota bacterium]
MRKVTIVLLLLVSLTVDGAASSEDIIGPEVVLNGTVAHISFTLSLTEEQLTLIREGMEKELIFYIDLFRKWQLWPDEFIRGRKITRTIKANPVKGEFKVISVNETTILEKRFSSFDSMLRWALNIKDIQITLSELSDSGVYFIRITIESVKQKPPQFYSYVLFFADDKDFKIRKDSEDFRIKVK